MAYVAFLRRLLGHKGPVFIVGQEVTSGTDHKCPHCNGKGKCEVMRSDDVYSQWTEVVTCSTCRGTKRVSMTHEARAYHHWSLKVSSRGVELSMELKRPGIVHLDQHKADAEASRLNAEDATRKKKNVQRPKEPLESALL